MCHWQGMTKIINDTDYYYLYNYNTLPPLVRYYICATVFNFLTCLLLDFILILYFIECLHDLST